MTINNDLVENNFVFECDSNELGNIVNRIYDNLAFHQVIPLENKLFYDKSFSVIEQLDLDELITHSNWLKMSAAPLRQSMGVRGFRGILWRINNIFIYVFGSEQIKFNRKLRDFIGILMETLHVIDDQINALNSLQLSLIQEIKQAKNMEARIQKLEMHLLSSQQLNMELENKIIAMHKEYNIDNPNSTEKENNQNSSLV